MCRYSMRRPYDISFVCFPCRRSFKHPSMTGSLKGPDGKPVLNAEGLEVADVVRCPECRKPAIRMGRDFKAPRRESDRQWEKLALMVERHGPGLFDTCGCYGPSYNIGYEHRTFGDVKRALVRGHVTGRKRATEKGGNLLKRAQARLA